MKKIQNVVEDALQRMKTSGYLVERDGPRFGIDINRDSKACTQALKKRDDDENNKN